MDNSESINYAGLRLERHRIKPQPGAPDPDSQTISHTGRPIPETLRHALLWSTRRHGLAE